jgi:POT family proton-dependent oligopeptide transporter
LIIMPVMPGYRHAPLPSSRLPAGIPYIIANEAAERFSFYGMRAILVVFMTGYLLDAQGNAAPMADAEARGWYHLFVSAVYFTPLLGALLSDVLLGKYRTIMLLSLLYCAGHLALALDHTRIGLAIGLGLIALGAGGIKPCVSAHVGDQFGQQNSHLLATVFGWFYFAVNLGGFLSMLITPWLMRTQGAATAFALPGLLMLAATLIFRAGRFRFVHIPPAGGRFVREVFSRDGLRVLTRLGSLYLCVAMFWALFDQTGSAWVLQAQHMDPRLLGMEILPAQIQAANPLLVLLLIPLFAYVVYPLIGRFWALTALRKMGMGMFLTVAAFGISAWIQTQIDQGLVPSIAWQLLAYLVLTASEVMVSITCLEFSYTQAPRSMKSFVMAFFMLSIAAGNLFTSAVNFVIDGKGGEGALAGADYYLFFAGLMMATAVLFTLLAQRYRGKICLQESVAEALPGRD